MSFISRAVHILRYTTWLLWQILIGSVLMAYDTITAGRYIAPIVVYYPLRVRSEKEIAAFIASITMTPGTLALGLTGPKEVDDDALAGMRNPEDITTVASSEYATTGLDQVQRFLAVHAMYGEDPLEVLHDLAVMEAHLAPHVRNRKQYFDVKHLVERGTPGPRGFQGNRGGRASDETIFDVQKVDSTPHAAAFAAAILRQHEELNPETLYAMDPSELKERAAGYIKEATTSTATAAHDKALAESRKAQEEKKSKKATSHRRKHRHPKKNTPENSTTMPYTEHIAEALSDRSKRRFGRRIRPLASSQSSGVHKPITRIEDYLTRIQNEDSDASAQESRGGFTHPHPVSGFFASSLREQKATNSQERKEK